MSNLTYIFNYSHWNTLSCFFFVETGVKFVVTARGNKDDQPAKRPKTEDTTPHHFQSTTVDHFYSQHFDRQGIV